MNRKTQDIDGLIEQVLLELNTEHTTSGKLAILKVADRLGFVYSASDATLDRIAAMIRGLSLSFLFEKRRTEREGKVSAKVFRLTPRFHLVVNKNET